ncbi:MAG: DUF4124 domain-containing protein [Legionellales bacterium]|nr:DUF4124 domain-containing protein [Legionellales bacterium]
MSHRKNFLFLIPFVVFSLFISPLWATTIYRSVDAKGVTTFSDRQLTNHQESHAITLNKEATNTYSNPNTAELFTNEDDLQPSASVQQHLASQKKLRQAHREMLAAENHLKEKTLDLQHAQTKLDNIAPTFDQQVNLQQAQVSLAQQALNDAKTSLALAQQRVLQAMHDVKNH